MLNTRGRWIMIEHWTNTKFKSLVHHRQWATVNLWKGQRTRVRVFRPPGNLAVYNKNENVIIFRCKSTEILPLNNLDFAPFSLSVLLYTLPPLRFTTPYC